MPQSHCCRVQTYDRRLQVSFWPSRTCIECCRRLPIRCLHATEASSQRFTEEERSSACPEAKPGQENPASPPSHRRPPDTEQGGKPRWCYQKKARIDPLARPALLAVAKLLGGDSSILALYSANSTRRRRDCLPRDVAGPGLGICNDMHTTSSVSGSLGPVVADVTELHTTSLS